MLFGVREYSHGPLFVRSIPGQVPMSFGFLANDGGYIL